MQKNFKWGLPVVVAAVLAACSTGESPAPSGDTPTAQTTASAPTTTRWSGSGAPKTSATATTAETPAAAGPKTGILAVTDESAHRTYGLIDPNSGDYTKVASFPLMQTTGSVPFNELVLSPDLTKLAVSQRVDGHAAAGWIDAQGNFTSATPPATDAGPFGGNPPTHEAIGFDGAGNYYYRSSSRGSRTYQMFKLSAGSTSNPEEITTDAARSSELTAYRNFDGTMQFGCSNVLSWLGPNSIVFVAGGAEQIDVRPVTGTDARGCPEFRGTDIPLLPATNTNTVRDAVGSPDASQVAFKLDDPDAGPNNSGAQVVHVVGVDGSSQPKPLNVDALTPLQMAGTTLLAWL